MFTYIHLHNFKNFSDVTFNLCDKHGTPKKLIVLYGENGAGKTNLASAFLLLGDSLRTMNMRDILENILKENPELKHTDFSANYIKSHYKGMESIIETNKMAATSPDEHMSLEFGFIIDGNHGRYLIETNNTLVIHERLDYLLVKNRSTYFDITPEERKINSKLFGDRRSKADVLDVCSKFWGKHTFLSILLHEIYDKSDDFIEKQINDNFKQVLNQLLQLSCKVKFGTYLEQGGLSNPETMLGSYDEGRIAPDQEELLNRAEKLLNKFFNCVSRDKVKAYYKRTAEDGMIHYQLMLTELIAGKERTIPFPMESTGTQRMVDLLPYLLVSVGGSTTVIDEFDTGVHDLLVKTIVTSLYYSVSGQLILTTHNTILMESLIPKECIYVINETENGDREIETLTHYDQKIHENTSIRRQYLKGTYSGIPRDQILNFKKLFADL